MCISFKKLKQSNENNACYSFEELYADSKQNKLVCLMALGVFVGLLLLTVGGFLFVENITTINPGIRYKGYVNIIGSFTTLVFLLAGTSLVLLKLGISYYRIAARFLFALVVMLVIFFTLQGLLVIFGSQYTVIIHNPFISAYLGISFALIILNVSNFGLNSRGNYRFILVSNIIVVSSSLIFLLGNSLNLYGITSLWRLPDFVLPTFVLLNFLGTLFLGVSLRTTFRNITVRYNKRNIQVIALLFFLIPIVFLVHDYLFRHYGKIDQTLLMLVLAILISGGCISFLWILSHRFIDIESRYTPQQDNTVQENTTTNSSLKVLKASDIGRWSYNYETGELIGNKKIREILEVAKNRREVNLKEVWKTKIDTDDIHRIKASIAEAIKKKEPFSLQCRIITNNGNKKWIDAFGEVVFGLGNKPIRLVGICYVYNIDPAPDKDEM